MTARELAEKAASEALGWPLKLDGREYRTHTLCVVMPEAHAAVAGAILAARDAALEEAAQEVANNCPENYPSGAPCCCSDAAARIRSLKDTP